MEPATFALGAAWYAVFLLSLTLHEAAHAWSAYKLGDPTAYHGGQVTLNPWPHVRREPFGTVLIPLLSFAFSGFMIGWASAPYDPAWARRHPKRELAMSLAGPAANFLLVLLAGGIILGGLATGAFVTPETANFDRVVEASAGGGASAGLATVLSILFSLNLLLGTFNLLPLPPLDGSALIPLVLGERQAERYRDFLATTPAISFLGLIVAWKLFPPVFNWIFVVALNLLHPGAAYG